MRFAFAAFLFLAACHSHDHDGYATFQACFDEHTTVESLPVPQAIVICCLDHPVNGVSEVCGADANSCKTYLSTNLASTSATTAQVDAACADYATQKDM